MSRFLDAVHVFVVHVSFKVYICTYKYVLPFEILTSCRSQSSNKYMY